MVARPRTRKGESTSVGRWRGSLSPCSASRWRAFTYAKVAARCSTESRMRITIARRCVRIALVTRRPEFFLRREGFWLIRDVRREGSPLGSGPLLRWGNGLRAGARVAPFHPLLLLLRPFPALGVVAVLARLAWLRGRARPVRSLGGYPLLSSRSRNACAFMVCAGGVAYNRDATLDRLYDEEPTDHARKPFQPPAGHIFRTARQGPPDRGRHQRRHARDPHGASGSRRQLQGGEVVRRAHEGALPRRRGARLAHAGAERREDRARRAHRAVGPHRLQARALEPHPQRHHARGPAGLRQDDGRREAGLAPEAGEPRAVARGLRRVPTRRGRSAGDARWRDRRAGVSRRRAGSGEDRDRGRPGRHRQPARRGHRGHGGTAARGRGDDG